jgi:CRP-like cAMP-binding protein
MMARASQPIHKPIRIRATRGWPLEHGDETPLLTFSASELSELGRLAQIIDYRTSGSQIFSQGDDATFVYLLVDGVVRTHHTLQGGDRQVLAFHWPGDLFGLAEAGKYVSSAEAVSSSTVYRFPFRKLEQFLLKNPNVQDRFLVKAMHDLRKAQRQLIIMGRFDVPRRLAAFMLDCSGHEHYFDPDQDILTLPMSRYDIADYLGTSAETVTRALARLQTEGMLDRISARTLKLDRNRLRAFIGLN